MSGLCDILMENPIIAAIRSDADLAKVAESRVGIVFALYGNITDIPEICGKLRDHGKTVFVHADMIDGLKGDIAGIEYLKETARPAGILSTKVNVIKYSKQLGLETILRVFLLDSLSLKTGLKSIREVRPDAVEVMPGMVCSALCGKGVCINVPVIASGLIVSKEQILDSISHGAIAVSTSTSELWNL